MLRRRSPAARARSSSSALRRVATRVVRDDLAVAARDDARSVLRDVVLVRDHQHRDAALEVQPLEDPHHLDAGARVEVAGRLVGEQDRRVGDERARDRDALLLTAGQLIRVMIGALAEADRRRALPSRACAVPTAFIFAAAVEQRQLDVVERGRSRQQVESLKDEADLLVPDFRELVLATSATRPGRPGCTGRTSVDRGSRGCASASTCPTPTVR